MFERHLGFKCNSNEKDLKHYDMFVSNMALESWVNLYMIIVLVPYCCQNKLSQIYRIKIMQIIPLNQKPRCWQNSFLLEASERNMSFLFPVSRRWLHSVVSATFLHLQGHSFNPWSHRHISFFWLILLSFSTKTLVIILGPYQFLT
jgi:hypothetical protein